MIKQKYIALTLLTTILIIAPTSPTTCDDPKCSKCDANQTCTVCKSPYDYIRINSCLSCNPGNFFNPKNLTCSSCNSKNCKNCKQENSCEICKEGYFLTTGTPAVCALCSLKGCKKCDRADPSVCAECEEKHFKDAQQGCVHCRTYCKKCEGKDKCLECEKGTKMDKKGECVADGDSFLAIVAPILGIMLFMSVLLSWAVGREQYDQTMNRSAKKKLDDFLKDRNENIRMGN
jgi:hypothetical protein